MACKCSPSLVRLMRAFADRGHVNSGCCGDLAHQARKSDHNTDASGYAHAQDIHEKNDHDMQPFVDFIMRNPEKFRQVKYMIYEGHMYYPNPGVRAAGKYVYTGPNAHAAHLHVSIHTDATFYPGSWYVDEAYSPTPAPSEEEDDMWFVQVAPKGAAEKPTDPTYVIGSKVVAITTTEGWNAAKKRFGDPFRLPFDDYAQFLLELNGKQV